VTSFPHPTGARRFKSALIQICSSRDVERNLAELGAIIRDAAAAGADYIQTPEIATVMETDSSRLPEIFQPEQGNRALGFYSDLARELGIWLHIGSMAIAVAPRYANRSFLFSPDGRITARYDKIHLFDADVGGQVFTESQRYIRGARAVLARLPWTTLGFSICYDMRFPTLYRALAKAGAEVIAVPSAFIVASGSSHWHTLLRARAIESQCFILAAAQGGVHECGRHTNGHSIAISPWGEIIAEADGHTPGFILADIDLMAIAEARRRIPSLDADHPFAIEHAEDSASGLADLVVR
jgi:predicted amidohydrolase